MMIKRHGKLTGRHKINSGALSQKLMRSGLPFEEWLLATEEQRNMAAVQLQGADLRRAQLQGANLWKAQLQGANLWKAQLHAGFVEAQLQGADLRRSDLDGATLDLVK